LPKMDEVTALVDLRQEFLRLGQDA